MAKDERRISSETGHVVERGIQSEVNNITAGLIDMQAYALEKGDEKLAKMINELMKSPLNLNYMLNLWAKNDISGLISWIEGKR